MAQRPIRTLLLGLAFLVSLTALLVSAETMKAELDRLAGGSSWFFELEIVRGLRVTAILLGPTLALVPALLRLFRGPAVEPDPRAKPLRGVEVLLVLAMLVTGLARMENDAPISKDGSSYLTDSVEIAEAGGIANLPWRMVTGDYLESNRHPFYAATLSTVAERSDRFTDRARLFSLAGTLIALWLAMRYARKRWGPHGALIAGVLFATNGVVLETSVNVGCESWLMVFLILWFDRATAPLTRRNQLALGVLAALAYLTKGTGTLILAATCLHLLLTLRRRALVPLAFVLGAFVVVASPLLVRNTVVHSNPVYNVNSSQALWLDDWSDFEDPEVMERAGPLEYLRSHSPADIVERLAVGVFKESIHVLQIFSPASPWAGLGLPVLILVALCLRHDQDRERRRLYLVFLALFFLAFAWYAKVVQGWRFVGSLVPLLLLPAGALGPRLAATPVRARRLEAGTALVAALLILAGLLDGALAVRPNRFEANATGAAVHAFLREHVGDRPDLHYLLGPSDSLTCDWDLRVRGLRHRFPRTEKELAELLAGNEGERIRFALIAVPVADDPRVSDAWVRPGPSGLELADPPADWSLFEALPPTRPEVLIFRRTARKK